MMYDTRGRQVDTTVHCTVVSTCLPRVSYICTIHADSERFLEVRHSSFLFLHRAPPGSVCLRPGCLPYLEPGGNVLAGLLMEC
jgi:hypothetical protein